MRVCHRLAIRAAADLADLARPLGDARGLAEALAIGHEFHDHLERHGELVRALPSGGDPHLAMDLAAGRAELSRLTGASSPPAWAAVARAAGDLRHPLDVAYARFREAEAILLARGPRATARAAAAEALEIARTVGASSLQRDIEALAVRSRLSLEAQPVDGQGARATSAHRPVPFGLTPRELEVLERVTLGRSNREIAAELFISEKTASVHVSNVKSKLGANGRAEIAAIAVRLGLVPATG
jgi:DNA-binding CsgD family transcriptional regulator